MKKKKLRLALAAALLAALSAVSCGRFSDASPRMVLVIVVDQLRADYLTRFEDLYQGGFKTLLERGAVFDEALFRHAVTITAAGHAVIGSGLHPSTTGVIGNTWWNYGSGEDMSCVDDPKYPTVGGPGLAASPRALLGDSLGDHIKQRRGGSKVIGISWKGRAAMFTTGRQADGAYWVSDECGCLITSQYYRAELPEWAREVNAEKILERYAGRSWERLLEDEQIYRKFAGADDEPGEKSPNAFPHEIPPADDPSFIDRARVSPANDELVLEAALKALEAEDLGRDGEPDLLAVLFSGTDVIGHDYGPLSHEAMDNHLRLDRLLGRLLDAVDRRVGLENTIVAFSADHGVLSLPEALAGGKRVSKQDIIETVDAAARAAFPALDHAAVNVNAGNVYLDLPYLEQRGVARLAVEDAAAAALRARDDVEAVYTHRDLLGDPPADDPYWPLYRASLFEQRSPQIFVRWKEEVYAGAGAAGTSHGSPYRHDRHVPLILMGAGVQAGRYSEPSGPEDIAPTTAKLLGFDIPKEPDARILSEALK